jgi:hypothetical protein
VWEHPQRRVAEQRRQPGRQSRHVFAYQKIAAHFADLIVKRREVIQLKMALHEAGHHQTFHHSHELIVRLQAAIRHLGELQVRDSRRLIGIGNHEPR